MPRWLLCPLLWVWNLRLVRVVDTCVQILLAFSVLEQKNRLGLWPNQSQSGSRTCTHIAPHHNNMKDVRRKGVLFVFALSVESTDLLYDSYLRQSEVRVYGKTLTMNRQTWKTMS